MNEGPMQVSEKLSNFQRINGHTDRLQNRTLKLINEISDLNKEILGVTIDDTKKEEQAPLSGWLSYHAEQLNDVNKNIDAIEEMISMFKKEFNLGGEK
jgi:predicted transcriptional regulator